MLRWGKFLLVGHPGYVLSLFRRDAEVMGLFRAAYESLPVIVLVNHYWEFNFDGKAEPDPERLELWHGILNFILQDPEAEVVSFRTLYDHLQAN
jgi:hypothetical protein